MIAILNPYSLKGLLKSSNNAKFSRCRFSFNHWQNMVKINFQLGIAPCTAVDPQASYTARDAERILNTVDALLSSPDVAWDGSPTPSLLTALEVFGRFYSPYGRWWFMLLYLGTPKIQLLLLLICSWFQRVSRNHGGCLAIRDAILQQ